MPKSTVSQIMLKSAGITNNIIKLFNGSDKKRLNIYKISLSTAAFDRFSSYGFLVIFNPIYKLYSKNER